MDSKNPNNTYLNDEGAVLSAEPEIIVQKNGFGKVVFLIIGLVAGVLLTLILVCGLKRTDPEEVVEKTEGAGYDSPEEAVEAYVNYLKEEDLEGAISTFAVESYVDNYDMGEYYEYIQGLYNAYLVNGGQMTSGFYYDSDMARDLNLESRRAYILNGIHRQLLQIIMQNSDDEELAEAVRTGTRYDVDGAGTVKEIMRFFSTDPELDSIEIGDFLDEKDIEFFEDSVTRAYDHLEKIWDADVESVMVELEIDDEDYTLFMLCVCYDERWYIADFNNPIGTSLGIGPSKGLEADENLPD